MTDGESYSLSSGSLPTGLSLNAISGVARISGTVSNGADPDFGSNTSNFTVVATNGVVKILDHSLSALSPDLLVENVDRLMKAVT